MSLVVASCRETPSDPMSAPGLTAPTEASKPEPSAAAAPTATAPTGSATPTSNDSGEPTATGTGTATPPSDLAPPEQSAGPAAPSASGASTAQAQTTERGAASSDAAYSAWLEASNPYRVGKPGAVRAVLVAGKGYKCNEKYPYKFKLDAPPAGLSYPEQTARGIQYGAQRSVLPVPIVPASAGTYTVSGTFSLSVCTAATCKIQREKLAVTVRVEP